MRLDLYPERTVFWVILLDANQELLLLPKAIGWLDLINPFPLGRFLESMSKHFRLRRR